jgi:hypothetical protein
LALPALTLITATGKELADLVSMLAGVDRHIAKSLLDQLCAFEIAAHLHAWLIGIVCIPPSVHSAGQALFCEVVDDLLAEPMPRNSQHTVRSAAY